MNKFKLHACVSALAGAGLLVACGGGGGSSAGSGGSNVATGPLTLTGIVAKGAALSGAAVSAKLGELARNEDLSRYIL